MIASTHLTVGAAAGAALYRFLNPRKRSDLIVASFVALFLGIFSHLLLDEIPHSEYVMIPKDILLLVLFGELFLVFGLIFYFGIKRLRNRDKGEEVLIMAGMIGGALPDLAFVVYNLFGIKWQWLKSFININTFFHGTTYLSGWISFPVQIFISVISVYLIYLLSIKNKKPGN